MNREFREIPDEATWLEWRKHDLTSTQIPALFDLSPYHTRFELYHAKKNGLVLPFRENERMAKGKRIEGYAANEIAIAHGFAVSPANVYARIPELRMASSFDFFVYCPTRGKGILEIKAVDTFRHKANWKDDEIPPHIELQARHQMFLADREWVMVAAFTSIYEHHEYLFTRDRAYDEGFIAEARRFWDDVDAGREPTPDFTRDGAVIARLHSELEEDFADKTLDDDFNETVAEYMRNKREADAFSAKADELKAKMLFQIGEKRGAFSSRYKITAGMTNGSEGTLVTPEMVGERIGARAGYRQCLVKDLTKGKK